MEVNFDLKIVMETLRQFYNYCYVNMQIDSLNWLVKQIFAWHRFLMFPLPIQVRETVSFLQGLQDHMQNLNSTTKP